MDDTLDFEIPVNKSDLEDFDFGTEENNETVIDKELEKE